MDETESKKITSLPKHFAIKSIYTNTYLRYVHEDSKLHGFLQFSGEELVTPYTKFAVENSKTGKKGLVHIRCCYNNKYWVRSSPSSHYIVAAANEPEEDQSKYTCTLFQPIYDHHLGGFRLRHVQLDRNLQVQWLPHELHFVCLFAKSSRPERNRTDLYTIINWDSIILLPKYVAFKGDNGKYLVPYDDSGVTFMQFSSNDLGDPLVANEVFITPDGRVRIKNRHSGKFWVRGSDWIHCKSTKETSLDDPNSLFLPVNLDSNVLALRNLGNNCFCKRLTADRKESCLSAAIDYITDEVRLEITEPVLSREVYNVDFRLLDARIYNEKPLVMASGVVVNKNTTADKLSLKMSYEDTNTSTWNSSVWVKLGIAVEISTGIPLISEGKVEVSVEVSEEYKWGATQQLKNLVEVYQEIVVPPSTKVKTSIIATQGSCDIPFSYTQRDKLMNGRVVVHRLHDGVYTGVNCYNYQFLAEEL